MTPTQNQLVGEVIAKWLFYTLLLVLASWMWLYARDHFGLLFGKHVSELSFGGMLLCLMFLRVVFRIIVHGGNDEFPKRGK